MANRLMRNAVFFMASVVACAAIVLSCRRDTDFESPYMPGSPGYAGDEWTRDADGNGVADSLDKYSPACKLPPRQCLENAKVISRISGAQNTLTAREMLLWLGDSGQAPSLVWSPAEGAVRGYILSSSDTTKVKVRGTYLVPVSIGGAQITVTVPGADSLSASFIARVVSDGKRVQSVSSSDITIKVGEDIVPNLTWLPADAVHRDFFLASDRPEVARVSGQTLRGLFPGKAGIVLQTLDGGHKTAFSMTVIEGSVIVYTDSIWAEDMFLVKGDSAEAPTLHWTPEKVTFKLYRLASLSDTSVVALNEDQTKIVPKGPGTARIILLVLDGSRGGCDFVVTVSSEAVPVKGVSASNLNLIAGGDLVLPKLTWLPPDATNRKYTLYSRDETVAMVQGSMISPLSMGAADVIITTQDGGYQDSFTVSVGRPDTANHVDSVRVQNLSVAIGSEKRPTTTWYPDNAGNRSYLLFSSDTTIAKASGENVKAVKVGTVDFILTALDGGSSSGFTVTVFPPETKVQMVNADTMFLVVDQEQSPTLTWSPSGATNLNYGLTSLDTNFAVIVNGTRVKAKAVGIAKIQLKSADGPITQFTVVITAKAVNLVSMTAPPVYMNMGDAPKDPVVVFNPANATNKNITLKSPGGTSVFSINSLNKIVAVGPGKAPLTIVSNENAALSVVCTVTVSALVKSVSAKDDTLRLGQVEKDVSTLLTWDPPNATDKGFALKSNDTNIVKPNGRFYMAVGGGKTTVIVKATDGSDKADTFNVWVKIPVTSVVAKDFTMKTTDPLYNTWPLLTFNPSTASDKNWHLSYASPAASPAPSTIVTIVGGWQFQPVGPGTARIIVMSIDNNAAKDTFNLTVLQPVTSLTAPATPIYMKVGDPDRDIGVGVQPANASDKTYTLVVATPGVVSVVNNKLHAVGAGTTNLTAASVSDPSKTVTFSATVAIGVVYISAADLSMRVGDPLREPALTWNPTNATNKSHTLVSTSNTSAVLINANKLQAVGAGSSNIVVSANDGNKLDTFTVTVSQPVVSLSVADMTVKRPEGDKDPVIAWNPTNATNKGYTLTGGTPGIASVVANRIHPIGFGTTSFVVTSSDAGKADTFNVFVAVPLESIKAANIIMNRNDEDVTPTVTYTPSDAPNKGYTLFSADTDVVTIVNGRIHAVAWGRATVTITSTENTTLKDTFLVDVSGFGF
jgi:uncharacterized protein YjdB